MDLPLWTYPALFVTGLAAGIVDSIAGGGGLITLPVLLGIGVDPLYALGTNKLQGSFGSGSATVHYARAGVVNVRECTLGIILMLIGSALGAFTAIQIQPQLLKRIIPFLLLLAVAIYIFSRPKLGSEDHPPKMHPTPFYAIFGLVLGFYDGFFGPGTGSFWAVAYIVGMGFNLLKATGYTKAVNFAGNLGALIVFATYGQVNYLLGMTMAAGQLVGAYIGSHLVIKNGAKFIRPIFIAVVLALIAKLIYDNFLK